MSPRKKTAEPAPIVRTPAKKTTRARSTTTGRTVGKAATKADPAGTVVETVEGPLDEFLRKFKAPTKVPKSYGSVADLLYTTRADRLALSKAVAALEDYEKALKNHLIENLSKDDSSGAAGKVARAQIVVEPQPVVEDWDEFYKHIKRKGEFDLLNRAVNRTAVRERWNNGKAIPGVGTFDAVKVSVTKVN